MSTIRHPNIVQFLGVCYSSDSRVPALVMERMLTNLHSLLMLQLNPPSPSSEAGNSTPLALSLASKISILHDVASGLAYLHEQSPPIIHLNLSARNVLLNSAMVAKISDLLRANSLSRARPSAEASVYMPSDAEEGTSTDIFSFGVIALFTFGGVFPCDLELASYYDEKSESMVPRTELERRSKYMDNLETKLHASQHLFKTSFFRRNYKCLTMLVEKCLDTINPRWPKHIHESLALLDTARCRIKINDSERNKRELLQALQTQPRHQVRDWTLIRHANIKCEQIVFFCAEFGASFKRPGDRECRSKVPNSSEGGSVLATHNNS